MQAHVGSPCRHPYRFPCLSSASLGHFISFCFAAFNHREYFAHVMTPRRAGDTIHITSVYSVNITCSCEVYSSPNATNFHQKNHVISSMLHVPSRPTGWSWQACAFLPALNPTVQVLVIASIHPQAQSKKCPARDMSTVVQKSRMRH